MPVSKLPALDLEIADIQTRAKEMINETEYLGIKFGSDPKTVRNTCDFIRSEANKTLNLVQKEKDSIH